MSSFRFPPPAGTFPPVFQKADLIMEDSGKDCVKLFFTAMILVITSFFLKAKISKLFSWLWQRFYTKKSIPEECFQKDIIEMKKAIEQIVQDWIGMSKFISQIQNEQGSFMSRLQNLFETKSEMLEQGLRQTFETIQGDIQSMKAVIETLIQNPCVGQNGTANDEEAKIDQTDCEMRKTTGVSDSVRKNERSIEYDTSVLIKTVKKSLTDLLKDAKLHLSVDREQENRELEIILAKLSKDRDDIKKTILQAFSIGAEQAKKNYDKFGQIGEEAFKYMAVLNDNTNELLKRKLGEMDDALKNTLSVINRQTPDIETVRNTLENINGQFDEQFEKLSQIYQMNIEHCDMITLGLENTSDKWIQTVSKIEKMAKQMCEDTKHVRQIFKEIKDLANTPQKSNGEEKGRDEIMQSDSVGNNMIQDHHILSQKQDNRIFVYSCWERMRSVSCNVEDGCRSVSNLIYGLEQKLGSLNESIEKLDNFIRGLNLEVLAERAASVNYNETAEIVHGIMQVNQSDAGDGQSQTLHNVTSKMRNESLVHKIQNAIAIDNAIKLTEIILKRVGDKSQGSENLIPSKPNNALEESQPIPIADEEHASRNSPEPLVSKAEIRN